MSKGTICFDVDGTLITFDDKPNYETIGFLQYMHYQLGWTVYIWSGGGEDYARRWQDKLGLEEITEVISKGSIKPDIAIDDEEVTLGTVNIQVNEMEGRLK